MIVKGERVFLDMENLVIPFDIFLPLVIKF